jgi:hypothetical protein
LIFILHSRATLTSNHPLWSQFGPLALGLALEWSLQPTVLSEWSS